MLATTTTLADALAAAGGFVGKLSLSLYLDTGTATWTWDDPAGPVAFNVGQMYAGSGLDPASLEVTLYSDAACIGGSTIGQAMMGAAAPFRGKRLVLALVVNTAAVGGTEAFVLFDGHVTQQKADTLGVTLQATGAMSSADQRQGTMPVELQCPWVLYSADCGATRIDTSLTVAAGTITATDFPVVVSYGSATIGDLITMANGETALVRWTISPVRIGLDRPVTPPAPGVTVTLTTGCRKFFADCRDRHSNAARFGGCPWRPSKSITGGL